MYSILKSKWPLIDKFKNRKKNPNVNVIICFYKGVIESKKVMLFIPFFLLLVVIIRSVLVIKDHLCGITYSRVFNYVKSRFLNGSIYGK